jgi:SAM-dependent methyltransferase
VSFGQHDAVDNLPSEYDLVTMFDVLHDIAQPVEVLRNVRRSLRPEGTLLLMEMRSADRREDNAGPIATILYATSVLFCVPTSIATGGDGLGTLGLPEARVRELCAEAGFGSVDRLPIENPFNILYAVRP